MKLENNKIQFQTEYAGKIQVQWKHVQSLYVDESALLLLADRFSKNVQSIEVKNGKAYEL